MITWLACYTRSGNTLLRMIMYDMFGMRSYSRYKDSVFERTAAIFNSVPARNGQLRFADAIFVSPQLRLAGVDQLALAHLP